MNNNTPMLFLSKIFRMLGPDISHLRQVYPPNAREHCQIDKLKGLRLEVGVVNCLDLPKAREYPG